MQCHFLTVHPPIFGFSADLKKYFCDAGAQDKSDIGTRARKINLSSVPCSLLGGCTVTVAYGTPPPAHARRCAGSLLAGGAGRAGGAPGVYRNGSLRYTPPHTQILGILSNVRGGFVCIYVSSVELKMLENFQEIIRKRSQNVQKIIRK